MKRINLSTPADLSEAAYEDARNQLLEPSQYRDYLTVSLKVSLWDADVAIAIMAKFKNAGVHIAMYYRADEWSISHGDKEVYSPGA